MVRRLLEADYEQHQAQPDEKHLRFWFRQLRTAELLMELARSHAPHCRELVTTRPLLAAALDGNNSELAVGLEVEQKREMELDREYWRPLREELERLRHQLRRQK